MHGAEEYRDEERRAPGTAGTDYAGTSIGRRLFLTIVVIFVIFALAFVLFQYQRERTFRRELIETQLAEYNIHFAESMQQYDGGDTLGFCRSFVRRHPARNLMVTVMRSDSSVVFSSAGTRPATGNGYLYSTTPFPSQGIVIETAMPENLQLSEVLETDKTYLYFALFMMVLLCVVLYRFTAPLGRNITNLRLFADRIWNREPVRSEDLAEFPDDELGEIAERIVTFYNRLEHTKNEQNRLKKELTHNIAHELKTPTASIMGYLETVINNEKIDDGTRKQFLMRSYAQAERLSMLIQDISTLNRMDEYDQAKHLPEAVGVADVISRIQGECAIQLSSKHMRFDSGVAGDVVVDADPSLVYSIFRNLTDNAIAYAGDSTTIKIYSEDAGRFWRFTFSDNGVGVDPHHLPRLFERFYRVDEGRSRAVGGTGLGLAIVRNAVVIYGGTITVTGDRGKGLAFEFTLPKAV